MRAERWHAAWVESAGEVHGARWSASYVIEDLRWRLTAPPPALAYNVSLLLDGRLLHSALHTAPGRYHVELDTPTVPGPALLELRVRNHFGQTLHHSIPVAFHTKISRLLKYLVLVPFVAMAVLMLGAAARLRILDLPT